MKNKELFKNNLNFQHIFSSCYAKQAAAYQAEYNQKNPRQRIWRHMLYKRTFYFFLDGRHVSVDIEIVRFRHARTNNTFTYYGTLFCAYSFFSVQFKRHAVCSSDELLSPSAVIISVKTLNCWRGWIHRERILSPVLHKSL